MNSKNILVLNDFLFSFNLISFSEFSAAVSSIEGKMSKSLKKLLKKLFVEETQETLAVADAKLGNVIKVSL